MTEHDSQSLPHDTAFDLLSNGRRRLLLRQLQGRDEIDLGDLATELSAIENDIEPEELSAQQRKRTYVSLYQTHIPKLESAGVVTFDPETGIVRPTDRVDELATYFRDESADVAWDRIYVTVATVGLVAYVLAGTVGAELVNAFYVGVLALLAVVVVSLAHLYTNRIVKDTTRIPAVGR